MHPSGRRHGQDVTHTALVGTEQVPAPDQRRLWQTPPRNDRHSLWIFDQKSPYEVFGKCTGVTEVFLLKLVVDSGHIG